MKQIFLIVLILGHINFFQPLLAWTPTAVPVTLIIRQADGSPAAGETVHLIRHPEMTVYTAVTDATGRCTLTVPRGLYEVGFQATLDGVSALAVAESGLGGFGLTVGETPVTYHFTLQPDSYVYFDGAPDAAIPVPVIPHLADLHVIGGAGEATPTPLPIAPVPKVTTAAASQAPTVATAKPEPETAVTTTLVILLISLIGMAMGVTGAIVSRRWR
ncbi:MAG: carboxypeptidase regulatory-like domain-containing protein [Anaerolineae bacterium]|nr:carboxypeptidase regulatory-like domain-containing protein [Anaerolineae bacterium]